MSTDEPQRLDRVLRAQLPSSTVAERDRLISGRRVRVNGQTVWLASWKVQPGDVVSIDHGASAAAAPAPGRPDLTWDARWVLADLGDLVAVDKPSGLRSEPRFEGDVGDLQSLARLHLDRPDLVVSHRLDRDTSGVIVLTRPGETRRRVTDAFAQRQVGKRYVAAVAHDAVLDDTGTIRERLGPHPAHRDRRQVVARGGDSAVTGFAVRQRRVDATIVDLVPHTGRTHQLRVHLAHLGAPILGDRLYGDERSASRLMLHSGRLTIELLGLDLVSPEPAEFRGPVGNSGRSSRPTT